MRPEAGLGVGVQAVDDVGHQRGRGDHRNHLIEQIGIVILQNAAMAAGLAGEQRQFVPPLAETQKQRQQTATQEMQKRLDAASERYGAEAEKTITKTAETVFEDKAVAPALKAAIGRSDVLVDALYVMGSDAEEMADFLKLAKADPIEALRKWFTIEALVKEELKSGKPNGAPARGPDGKFQPDRPARKEAPSPPRELGGNTAPPGDERERAARTGDFRTFKADADRRDMQRFKGQ